MMQTEFLIVGQGISGTFLSWYLHRAKRSFMVIDNGDKSASSRVAAGVINPVTGRRMVKTWMIDELLPFALKSYESMAMELGIDAISQKNIIDFFPSPQMLLAFRDRIAEDDQYLSFPENEQLYDTFFRYDFGYGEIAPCYVVQVGELLAAWRKHLTAARQLREEAFIFSDLIVNHDVTYRDINARTIVFCDGIHSADNMYFRSLPFAFNKGEALVIEAEQLPAGKIYKKGLSLVPLKDQLFWAGSSYEWNFQDSEPSGPFREKTLLQLRSWLKVPFRVMDHLSSVRPATIERRPFAGVHPHHPQVAILNGMGTKGCSLAPYFASQLAAELTGGVPVIPEANISRFTRILR